MKTCKKHIKNNENQIKSYDFLCPDSMCTCSLMRVWQCILNSAYETSQPLCRIRSWLTYVYFFFYAHMAVHSKFNLQSFVTIDCHDCHDCHMHIILCNMCSGEENICSKDMEMSFTCYLCFTSLADMAALRLLVMVASTSTFPIMNTTSDLSGEKEDVAALAAPCVVTVLKFHIA